MAIQCEVKGTVTTSESKKLSLKKLFFTDPFCEVSGTVLTVSKTNGRYTHEIDVYAVRDGQWASDWLHEIITQIKQKDPTAAIDLQMISRWG